MQFQVPQFIEVEDKIFGPLTLKQFLYLAGGAAVIFILYVVLPLFAVFLLGFPIAGFFLALAFYKLNGQPFVKVLENAFRHYTKMKIYTWKKREAAPKTQEQLLPSKGTPESVALPKLTKSKLEDLAWSLDIKSGEKQK